MTAADYLAQAVMAALLLLAWKHRALLDDMSDGNVERIEREEITAAEAQAWLDAMGAYK